MSSEELKSLIDYFKGVRVVSETARKRVAICNEKKDGKYVCPNRYTYPRFIPEFAVTLFRNVFPKRCRGCGCIIKEMTKVPNKKCALNKW